MQELPIETMLRDAAEAWRICNGIEGASLGALLGDLSCHVRALIQELEAAERWISVGEAMPLARPRRFGRMRSDNVLLWAFGETYIGCFVSPLAGSAAGAAWIAGNQWYCPEDVTHWRPLPPPPPRQTDDAEEGSPDREGPGSGPD